MPSRQVKIRLLAKAPRVRAGVWALVILAFWFTVTRHGVRRAWFVEQWEGVDARIVWVAIAIASGVILGVLIWRAESPRAKIQALPLIVMLCFVMGRFGWHLADEDERTPVVVIDRVRWIPETEEIEVHVLGTPGIARIHRRGDAKIRVGIVAGIEDSSVEILMGDRAVHVAEWSEDFARVHLGGNSRHLPLDLDYSLLLEIGTVRVPFRPHRYRYDSPFWRTGVPAEPTIRVAIAYVAIDGEEGKLITPVYEVPYKGSPEFTITKDLLQ